MMLEFGERLMPEDVGGFAIAIAAFILYLFWSAATEMGTKWPWRRSQKEEKTENREQP